MRPFVMVCGLALCGSAAYDTAAVWVHDAWQIERMQPERVTLADIPPPPRPPPPPPPPPRGPRSVAATDLHIAWGQHEVPAPEAMRGRAGAFTICLDTRGQITSVRREGSTGDDAYDRRLAAALWNWHYQPVMDKGRPIEVCTLITFPVAIQ